MKRSSRYVRRELLKKSDARLLTYSYSYYTRVCKAERGPIAVGARQANHANVRVSLRSTRLRKYNSGVFYRQVLRDVRIVFSTKRTTSLFNLYSISMSRATDTFIGNSALSKNNHNPPDYPKTNLCSMIDTSGPQPEYHRTWSRIDRKECHSRGHS
jgi:hypothetical protein